MSSNNSKIIRLMAFVVGALAIHLSQSAMAQSCRIKEIRGNDTVMELVDRDIAPDDSFGSGPGHNFVGGTVQCNNGTAPVEAMRNESERGRVILKIAGRHQFCQVGRSKSWTTTNFDCGIKGGGGGGNGRSDGIGKPIAIRTAIYRATAANDRRFSNVVGILARQCTGRPRCDVVVENANLGGDPSPAVVKRLDLEYSCGNNEVRRIALPEHSRTTLSCQ